MTFEQIDILGTSLGVNVFHCKQSKKKKDKKLPKEFYRNRFCANEDHTDIDIIKDLVKMGYVAIGSKINNGRDTLYYVTEEGIKEFIKLFKEYILEE